jgi:hypothetical protein
MTPEEHGRPSSGGGGEAPGPGPALTDPVAVGALFAEALRDPVGNRATLERVTTPESRPAWGDFTGAAAVLSSIEDWGVAGVAPKAAADPTVCYLGVLRGVTRDHDALEGRSEDVAAIINLVWRPDFGQWMVHGIGDHLRPGQIPHGPTARP